MQITLRLTLAAILAVSTLTLACGDDEPTPTSTPTAAATATPSPSPTTVPSVTATPGPLLNPVPEPPIDAAIDALASWLGPLADTSLVSIVSTEDVEWPNGCLGIARANIACTEALVPGFRIRLGLGVAVYEVRTDLAGDQTEWAPQTELLVRFAESSTNVALFTADDGNELPVRLVPGTAFGVNLLATEPGTPVGIAIADAPQGGDPILVWVDRVSEDVAATVPTATPSPTPTAPPPAPTASATPVPPTATPPPAAGTVTVVIQGFGFQPQQLEVDAGTTVTWVNKDPVAHDADSSDGLWDSPYLEEGQSTSHTFSEPGKYLYFCSIHPYMQGIVTVR